jgi:hypothetical protein
VAACCFICSILVSVNRHGLLPLGWKTDVLKSIRPERGLACVAPTYHGELSADAHPSTGTVFENGSALAGPADAPHDDIRRLGSGRFCFWGSAVYFSASDHSLPSTNGRIYTIRYPATLSGPAALSLHLITLVLVGASAMLAAKSQERRAEARRALAAFVGPLFYLVGLLGAIAGFVWYEAYRDPTGLPSLGLLSGLPQWIQPHPGVAKGYAARGILVAGAFLCTGSAGLGLLSALRVPIPRRLKDLAGFTVELCEQQFALILLTGVFFAGGLLWCWAHPALPPPQTVEKIIVDEQIKRAQRISQADVILIGDSSALMDVDAKLLGSLLGGRKVENLSTLGYVGAQGYAHLLDLCLSRGIGVRTVVLLMHGISLNRPTGDWDRWQDWVLTGRIFTEPEENPLVGLRARLSAVWLDRLFALPMPEAWGRSYGTHFELADAIAANAGSIYNPSLDFPAETGRWDAGDAGPDPHRDPGFTYRLSPAAALGLRTFALTAAKYPIQQVFFGITPAFLSSKTDRTIDENRQVSQEVGAIMRGALGARFEPLDLMPFRADEYFATAAHLNQIGRGHFTRTLASVLAPQLR